MDHTIETGKGTPREVPVSPEVFEQSAAQELSDPRKFPTMKTFSSGAKSTVKKPRYDLIPQRANELNAGRFEYGAARHGERNYRKGKGDEEFIKDRINHLYEHLMKFAEFRRTSDLAAIICNASILADVEADIVKDGANGETIVL